MSILDFVSDPYELDKFATNLHHEEQKLKFFKKIGNRELEKIQLIRLEKMYKQVMYWKLLNNYEKR